MKWLHNRIDEIGQVISGGTPNTNNSEFWEGDIVWITPNDLNKLNTPFIYDSERKITEEGLKFSSAKLFPPLSLVISTRAPIGYLAINKVPASTNQDCKTLVFNSKKSSLFFFYLIAKNLNSLLILGNGTTFSEISKKDLCKIELDYPTKFEEQTSIAHILSTVDKAIEGTEKLIAKYKRIKTGLMQDLLTKGIDENGNIRSEKTHKFKDSPLGRIPVEWEVKTVKEFANIVTGSNDTQDKVEDGLYPFYVRSQQIERINTFSFDGEGVLTSGDGVGVGKIYHYANGKFSFHQRVYLIHSFSDFILGKYFYIYFSNHFENEIMKYSAKTTVDSVRLHMISDMLIPIPTIAEQKLIVNNIMEIENFIQIENEARIKFQKIKSGLMQDLLTGKVRVPEELIEEINSKANVA